jgi:thiol-disulfide isomerase/thioredoxin
MGYEWDARMCSLNRVGTPAADFSFTDTHGRLRTLYGVKSEYTVLIFGNPGCKACMEIMEAMGSTPAVAALIESGRLQVVDVYIDQEIEDWKAHIAEYPASWINGYDHGYTIRTDLIYNVRGIPSIYLLDADKTVLMKDAPQEKVLEALTML